MSKILPFPNLNLTSFTGSKDPWWIQIKTQIPACTYYFGPFDTEREAKLYKLGYVEDLMQENAQGLVVKTQRCRPLQLTVDSFE
jgi:hypothetical protein